MHPFERISKSPAADIVWLAAGAGAAVAWRDGEMVDPPTDGEDDIPAFTEVGDAYGEAEAAEWVSLEVGRLVDSLPREESILAAIGRASLVVAERPAAAMIPYDAADRHAAAALLGCAMLLRFPQERLKGPSGGGPARLLLLDTCLGIVAMRGIGTVDDAIDLSRQPGFWSDVEEEAA